MRKIILGVLAVSLMAFATAANAITYNVNRSIGNGSVIGYLQTDGTLGALGEDNFVTWELTFSSPNLRTTYVANYFNSHIMSFESFSGKNSLVATDKDLTFNYSNIRRFFLVQLDDSSAIWCMITIGDCASPITHFTETLHDRGAGLYELAEKTQYSRITGPVKIGTVSVVPVPAGLPLLAGGIGILGLIGWRRKRCAV